MSLGVLDDGRGVERNGAKRCASHKGLGLGLALGLWLGLGLPLGLGLGLALGLGFGIRCVGRLLVGSRRNEGRWRRASGVIDPLDHVTAMSHAEWFESNGEVSRCLLGLGLVSGLGLVLGLGLGVKG